MVRCSFPFFLSLPGRLFFSLFFSLFLFFSLHLQLFPCPYPHLIACSIHIHSCSLLLLLPSLSVSFPPSSFAAFPPLLCAAAQPGALDSNHGHPLTPLPVRVPGCLDPASCIPEPAPLRIRPFRHSYSYASPSLDLVSRQCLLLWLPSFLVFTEPALLFSSTCTCTTSLILGNRRRRQRPWRRVLPHKQHYAQLLYTATTAIPQSPSTCPVL